MLHHRLRSRRMSPVVKFEFVGFADSSSSSITVPSAALAGDLAVLLDRAGGLSIPSTVVPSGWASISNVSRSSGGLGVRQIMSYCSVVSGGGGQSITGMSSISNSKVIAVFRPSAPVTYSVQSKNDHTPQDTAPTTQTVSAQPLPYVILAGFGTTGTPSWPNAWYDGTRTGNKICLGYKIPVEGSNQSISASDLGNSNTLQSCAIVGTI